MVQTEKGARISMAKRGRASRADLGLTLVAAAERVGWDKRTLAKRVVGYEEEAAPPPQCRGWFRGIAIPEGLGTGYRFSPELLEEDLAAYRAEAELCSGFRKTDDGEWVACDQPALPEGRCAAHAANVTQPAELISCSRPECGTTKPRAGSWLRGHHGRGTFCSHRCRGLAQHAADADRLPNLNPDGARDHHAAVAATITASGSFDTAALSASRSANPWAYSPSQLRLIARGTKMVIDGSTRLVRPADIHVEQPWSGQLEVLERRASLANRAHGVGAATGLGKIIARLRGRTDGRPGALNENEIALATRLRLEDPRRWSWQKLADKLNSLRAPQYAVSHMTVQRAVKRNLGSP